MPERTRDFELALILNLVALTKENATVECTLAPLLALVEHMTGEHFDADAFRASDVNFTDYLIFALMSGMALLRQHPALESVEFRPKFTSKTDSITWIRQQRRKFGDTLPATSILETDLSPYRDELTAHIKRHLRKNR